MAKISLPSFGSNKPALPASLTAALDNATAVLAERSRLDALRGQLEESQRQAEDQKLKASAELDRAEADVLLGTDGDQPALMEKASAARAAVEAAGRDQERYAAALRALPMKLAEMDGRIEAAEMAVTEGLSEVRTKAITAYEADLQTAVKALGKVLAKGHAIEVTLGGLRNHLSEVYVPAPTAAEVPLLRGARLTLANDTVSLEGAWPDDAAAASIASTYQPLRLIADQLARHAQRIQDARALEERATNERSRAAAFGSGNSRWSSLPVKSHPLDAAPAGGLPRDVYRAPREASVAHAQDGVAAIDDEDAA